MFTRRLRLPPPGTETFFLWGPRQTGKTTLLQAAYPEALWIDLPRIKRRVVVCLEAKSRRTEDGILILGAGDFTEQLDAGNLF